MFGASLQQVLVGRYGLLLSAVDSITQLNLRMRSERVRGIDLPTPLIVEKCRMVKYRYSSIIIMHAQMIC